MHLFTILSCTDRSSDHHMEKLGQLGKCRSPRSCAFCRFSDRYFYFGSVGSYNDWRASHTPIHIYSQPRDRVHLPYLIEPRSWVQIKFATSGHTRYQAGRGMRAVLSPEVQTSPSEAILGVHERFFEVPRMRTPNRVHHFFFLHSTKLQESSRIFKNTSWSWIDNWFYTHWHDAWQTEHCPVCDHSRWDVV